MIKMYGIKNCSTVKKARDWLEDQGLAFEFIDFKKTPPSIELLESWIDTAGIDKVINKRGTTWRKLSEAEQTSVLQDRQLTLVSDSPSTIKRPVLQTDTGLFFGFKAEEYQKIFS